MLDEYLADFEESASEQTVPAPDEEASKTVVHGSHLLRVSVIGQVYSPYNSKRIIDVVAGAATK